MTANNLKLKDEQYLGKSKVRRNPAMDAGRPAQPLRTTASAHDTKIRQWDVRERALIVRVQRLKWLVAFKFRYHPTPVFTSFLVLVHSRLPCFPHPHMTTY